MLFICKSAGIDQCNNITPCIRPHQTKNNVRTAADFLNGDFGAQTDF